MLCRINKFALEFPDFRNSGIGRPAYAARSHLAGAAPLCRPAVSERMAANPGPQAQTGEEANLKVMSLRISELRPENPGFQNGAGGIG